MKRDTREELQGVLRFRPYKQITLDCHAFAIVINTMYYILNHGHKSSGGGVKQKSNYSAFTNFTELFFANISVTVCHTHIS